MKSVRVLALVLLLLPAWCALAEGQYRPPPRKGNVPTGADPFDEAVNPDRFRKGNVKLGTQELVGSGMTALHEEHQRILKELEELKTEIRNLKEGHR